VLFWGRFDVGCGDPFAHGVVVEGGKADPLASRADGWEEAVFVGGDEDDDGAWWWFFEGFEDGVLSLEVEEFGFVDDEDFGGDGFCLGRGGECHWVDEVFFDDGLGDCCEFGVAGFFVFVIASHFFTDDMEVWVGACVDKVLGLRC